MTSILLWNKNHSYTSILQEYFKPVFTFYNLKELQDYFELEKPINRIIILAELDWGDNKNDDFYGFDIIQILRVNYKITHPILICSTYRQESFFIRNIVPHYKGNILNAPAHQFLSLPHDFIKEPISWQVELEDDLLDDIIYTFYNFRGIAGDIIHNLQNELNINCKNKRINDFYIEIEELIKTNISKIESLVGSDNLDALNNILINVLSDLKTDLILEQKAIKMESTGFVYKNARNIVARYSEQIYGLLPKKLDEYNNIKDYRTLWEVLFIDDQKSNCDVVVNYFKERKIKCHSVSSNKEAQEILFKDIKKKKIAVVITDLRLIDDFETGRWQEKQGYQILNEIYGNHPNNIAYFVLTSKKGSIIKNINKNYNFNIHWYSKQDVITSNGAFNIFTKEIVKQGDIAFYKNRSQPILSAWINGNHQVKPLNQFYKVHCERKDYSKSETRINTLAKAYIDNYLNGNPNEKIDFMLHLNGSAVDEAMLNKFRYVILLGRRISVGLYYLIPEMSDFKYELNKQIEKIHSTKNQPVSYERQAYKCAVEEIIYKALRPNIEVKEADKTALFNSRFALSLENDLEESNLKNIDRVVNTFLLEEELAFIKEVADINFDQIQYDSDDLIVFESIADSLIDFFTGFNIEPPNNLLAFIEKRDVGKIRISIRDMINIIKQSSIIIKKFRKDETEIQILNDIIKSSSIDIKCVQLKNSITNYFFDQLQ
jgi:CheY-like chemotaxis protein